MTTGFHATHNFVSAKADGTDNTLVKPSNWNEDHVLVMDSGKILGRQTAGNGAVEQLDCSAYMAALLANADFAALAAALGLPSTGDGKLTLKTSADTGWVMMDDGTIGSATSGASTRANADTQNLFNLLYASPFTDAAVPLLTSTGTATTRAAQGSAATAFSNGCRISLPKQLGRAFIAAGTGAGLSARTLGTTGGEETHQLTLSEMASHTHANTLHDNGHQHQELADSGGAIANRIITGNGNGGANVGSALTASATTGITITNVSAGGDGAHNNMQPWSAWNVMVKL